MTNIMKCIDLHYNRGVMEFSNHLLLSIKTRQLNVLILLEFNRVQWHHPKNDQTTKRQQELNVHTQTE